MFLKGLRRSFLSLLLFSCFFGGIYPLLIWGIGEVFFHEKAQGSLFIDKTSGQIKGSFLIGQKFTQPHYFQPRLSYAGKEGYDGADSAESNLPFSSLTLLTRMKEQEVSYRIYNEVPSYILLPIDCVTSSASGLDPHISTQNAQLQAPRVAKARNLPLKGILSTIKQCTEKPTFGILGEKRVNVVRLNWMLDQILKKPENPTPLP